MEGVVIMVRPGLVLLWMGAVREVWHRVQGGRLSRGRRDGAQPGLAMQLQLQVVLLVEGVALQGEGGHRLRLHGDGGTGHRQPGHPRLHILPFAALRPVCDQLVQLV